MDLEIKQLLNSLIQTRLKNYTSEQVTEIIQKLKDKGLQVTGKGSISELTGLAKSTIYNLLSGSYKLDVTQRTARMIKSGLDISLLILHFEKYIPKDEVERIDLKRLVSVLMDCYKR